MVIPWDRLGDHFGPDAIDVAAGVVTVARSRIGRSQRVHVQLTRGPGDTQIVRVTSASLDCKRAAVVLGGSNDLSDEVTAESAPWLTILAHNDRMRDVSLRPSPDAVVVGADLVCIGSDRVDAAKLAAMIEHVARVADELELRATGRDVR